METEKYKNGSPEGIFQSLKLFFILIFAFVLIRTAWLDDDAWFTMRTVYNFIHGYGLTWNVTERVQVYTHPLWMFLLSFAYLFIREPLIILYLVPISVSIIAVVIFLYKLTDNLYSTLFGLIAILFSKAFIDYSTSGLENPLTHLILIVFLLVYFLWVDDTRKVFYLSLIAALAALNRLDTILIYFPALAYTVYRVGIKKSLLNVVLGFLPLVFWELFSIYYYGFPFPNTMYAKLNTGIQPLLLYKQGLNYLVDSLFRDHITLPLIAFGVIVAIRSKKAGNVVIAVGELLYLLYILRVGGDHMSGRFLTPLFVASLVLLVRVIPFDGSLNSVVLIATVFLIGMTGPTPAIFDQSGLEVAPRINGVNDDRSRKYQDTALKYINFRDPKLDDVHYEKGTATRQRDKRMSIGKASGEFAYYAGPDHHLVDTFALGDALLSRLPPIEQVKFRVGHYVREMPKGYWKNFWSYGDKIEDPSLREYYEKLSVVIHGDELFSRQRFIEIWRLNTGYYDYLIDQYLETLDD